VPRRSAATVPLAWAEIAACAWAVEAVSTVGRLVYTAAETAARIPRSSQPAGLAARTVPMVREHIADILLAVGNLRAGRRRHSPALALLQNTAGAAQDRAHTPDTAAAFRPLKPRCVDSARGVRSNPARHSLLPAKFEELDVLGKMGHTFGVVAQRFFPRRYTRSNSEVFKTRQFRKLQASRPGGPVFFIFEFD
jgi:hypothetical protein